MRKALVVAARELRERWLFFPAGLVLGCVPLALPAFGVSPLDSPSFGLMIAVVLGGAAALVAGGTMLARDAASSRLGFLFSQPVPWPAIWAGKWLAAVLLAGVTGLLAAVPWMIAYPTPQGTSWFDQMLDLQGTVLAISWLVVLVGLANLASTSFRSRSVFVAFDLACLAVAVWGVRHCPPVLCGADGAIRFWMLLATPALALLLASVAQVGIGRTDLRRAHRALSLTFWGLVMVMLLASAAHRHWVYSAGPSELRHASVLGSDASGRWVQVFGVSGRSACLNQVALLDLPSRRYLRLAQDPFFDTRGTHQSWSVVFAAHEEIGARWRTGSDEHSTVLELFDLSPSAPRVSRVHLDGTTTPPWRTFLELSPSGATALLVGESTAAALFDTRSGRKLASAGVRPGQYAARAVFTSETRVRVWLYDRNAARQVLDLDAGLAPEWSDFSVPGSGYDPAHPFMVPLPDGSRVVSFDGGVRLRDGRTGELIATLVEGVWSRSAALLGDGRIAVAASSGEGTWVSLFDRNGERLRDIDLSPEGRLGPVTRAVEVAPGLVAFGLGPRYAPRQSVVVDVDAGRVLNDLQGLRPADMWPPGAPGAPVRTDGTALFTGLSGELVSVDLATGKRTVVAGPGAPKGQAIEPVVVSPGDR